MRSFLLLLFAVFPFLAKAQLQENFTDGNFTANPVWSGDASLFTVNPAFQLQTNGPAITDNAYLSTASIAAAETTWEFWVNLKFGTSSSNLAEVYLISDQANLEGPINGYFVRIGDTDDEISLYKKTGTTVAKIIDGQNDRLSKSTSTTINNEVKVRITRSAANLWTLETNVLNVTGSTQAPGYVTEGTVTDATYNTSAFFGVLAKYTTANAQKFYFDDITIMDTGAPKLTSVSFISATQLDVLFSEPVALTTAQNTANYTVSGGSNPISAVRDAGNPALVHLTFAAALPNGTSTLSITGMQDLSGNTAATLSGQFTLDTVAPASFSVTVVSGTTLDILFNEPVSAASAQNTANYSVSGGSAPATAVRDAANQALVHLTFSATLPTGTHTVTATNIADLAGNVATSLTGNFSYNPAGISDFQDVRINEIMADFTPAVGLPAAEFVEIFNRSSKVLNLNGWKLFDATTTGGTLPAYNLQPGQYVILCAKADTATLKAFGKTLGLSTMPSMNDAGDQVRLYENTGKLVDKVTYSNTWYNDPTKTAGGWTLELKNPDYLCSVSANWSASVNPAGGTPGQANSILNTNPDTQAPSILRVETLSPTSLKIVLSESADSLSLVNAGFAIDLGINIVSKIISADLKEITLTVNPAITPNTTYTLTGSNVKDCSGNIAASVSAQFSSIPPSVADFQDVRINELVADFNPAPVGIPAAEFVEIYNRSNKALNLANWKLFDATTTGGTLPAYVMQPGQYVILCAKADTAAFRPFGKALGLSTWPSLNDSGDKIRLVDNTGKVIDNILYNTSWYNDPTKTGGGWSLELKSPDFLCSVASNWSASVSPAGGTPGQQNSNFNNATDTQAPVITRIETLTTSSIKIVFSESVDSLSYVNAAFSIDNGINVTAKAISTDLKEVTLTLNPAISAGTTYTLTAPNISDCSGNISASLTAQFSFVPPVVAAFQDVRINELVADYSPVVGLPEAEFVELYNRSNKTLSLANWKLFDATTSGGTLPAYNLAPGAFVILCAKADTASFSPFGKTLGLSTMPSLNDSGDDVKIIDNTGKLIDKITYTTAWYQDATKTGGGWSLELKNPQILCASSTNWSASIDASGGTPGRQNSVFSTAPDTQKPTLAGVETISPTTIKLTFSELMDSLSLVNATYTLNQGISVVSKVVTTGNFREITLMLSPALTTGTIYTIQVSGATDCPGNAINPVTVNFGSGVKPLFNQVLITEILADESPIVEGPLFNLPGVEYLEIHNPTAQVIDLNGMKLSDGGTAAIFPAVILLPGEYAVVCSSTKTAGFAPFNVKVIGVSNFPSLNNSGETITLRSETDVLIFSVEYSDTWYKDEAKKAGGWSLEMIDTSNPCTGIDNWTASVSNYGGTPGKENSVKGSRPDNTPPKLLKAQANSATELAVYFDEKITDASVNGATFTILNGGPAVINKALSSASATTVILTLAQPLKANEPLTLEVKNIQDCNGNLAGLQTATFALPVAGKKGDIVINEILFNPRTGGVDYIELINRSANYIDLASWQIANIENGIHSDEKAISTVPYVLGPGQFVVLTTRPDVVIAQYPNNNPNAFLTLSSLPSMNDDEGTLLLIDPTNQVFDSLYYTEDTQFAIIKDKNGVALERIRTFGESTMSNFHSAATTAGYGTPGLPNSQSQDVVVASSGLEIEPKVFSPDGDGFRDFTTFNFTSDKIGQVATITIFDARGREMKKLTRNELLAPNSFFRWDGTTNENRKAPVGYYVVLIELFDLTGKQQTFKETVAIGAKF